MAYAVCSTCRDALPSEKDLDWCHDVARNKERLLKSHRVGPKHCSPMQSDATTIDFLLGMGMSQPAFEDRASNAEDQASRSLRQSAPNNAA
jgi:hypothetical protein